MDWSKTKTIFIAVFLVLDLFLAVMFFNKYGASRFEVIKETTIEEKLQSDGVKYGKMPSDSGELSIITATPRTFTEKDLLFLTKQETAIEKNGTELVSTLNEPYETENASREKIVSFVRNNVLQGDHYAFWKRNREEKTVVFYQQIEGKKLFENPNGLLTVYLNEEGNIEGYTQTMLSSVEENRNEEAILPAFQALDALYKNGLVQPESEIKDAELGYYTFVQLTESQVLQVLSPTWYFQLIKGDKTEEMYVNAFDGSIYQTEKES